VGFEVFTAAIMKSSLFWGDNLKFRSKLSPQFLVPKNKPSKKKKQREAGSKQTPH
jgi:hypothetical protein